jgi:hypothetical protein
MANTAVIILIFAILGSTSPFTIDCTHGMSPSWQVIGSLYQCAATIATNPSHHTVTEVTGSHQHPMTNDDVRFIDIRGDSTLSFIPRGLLVFFPNAIAIRVWQTTVETLHGDELVEFGEQLQWLAIIYSNITTISSRFFEKLPSVAFMSFGYNQLRQVGGNLFTPLDLAVLQHVDFRFNACINDIAMVISQVPQLIRDVLASCPYDDEELLTTTSETEGTTSGNHTCFDGDVGDFVCELNEKVVEVQSDVVSTRDDLQGQLDETSGTVSDLQNELVQMRDEMDWMRDELLRLTTHPCACK